LVSRPRRLARQRELALIDEKWQSDARAAGAFTRRLPARSSINIEEPPSIV
jgi:hypothetical protein